MISAGLFLKNCMRGKCKEDDFEGVTVVVLRVCSMAGWGYAGVLVCGFRCAVL